MKKLYKVKKCQEIFVLENPSGTVLAVMKQP